jgi:hypothetical protein
MSADFQARQFVCGLLGDFSLPGWRTIPLPDGWRLHHHPDAPVEILSSDPHAPVIRIGRAFDLDAAGEGAGRYALLAWPEIRTDAGALLGLHYGAREGRRVVSSSAALAAQALGGHVRAPDLTGLEHRSHINYVPMPGAPFLGLRKLLHDQKLDLPGFRVLHRPSPIRRLASYDAALDALVGALLGFARDLKARTLGTVYLPLTAGLDSRTLAAAFLAAELPFETVTLDYCGKPEADVTVARAISRKLGLRHHVLRLTEPDADAAARFAAHTAGAFLDWDHTHIFPGGGYRYLGPGDVMVVGACFEVGRQTAGDACFKGLDFASATGEAVWRRRTGAPAPAAFAGFLDEWIAWRRLHPLDMDFAAAFYLDQRTGGWRAALEQGYDLLPGVSLCPANDARVYSALITPDAAAQREGRLQRDAIARLAPGLLAFPLNPKSLRHHAGALRRRLVARLRAALGAAPRREGLGDLSET